MKPLDIARVEEQGFSIFSDQQPDFKVFTLFADFKPNSYYANVCSSARPVSFVSKVPSPWGPYRGRWLHPGIHPTQPPEVVFGLGGTQGTV